VGKTNEVKFGAVVFVGGKYKDQLGYYDDDEGAKAIVYLGAPFQSPCVTVFRKDIRNVTSLDHEKFKREQPDLCILLGID
jgi:hypothetical protein